MKIIALALIPLNLLIASAAAVGEYLLSQTVASATLSDQLEVHNDATVACTVFLVMGVVAVLALVGFIIAPSPSSARSGAAQAGTTAPLSA